MASSELISRSDKMGDNPDFNTDPAARQPRRHSFHGEFLRENSSITVGSSSPPVGALLNGKQQADVCDILGLNGDYHDFDRVGSTLLDKFELESVWRQVRRHRTVNGVSDGTEESTYSPSQRLHYDGHESDIESSFASQWGGAIRRGGSGHFHRPLRHGRSPSKDDHQHGGTAPKFLHQLIRLGISKSVSSPALCSSVATANSIRDLRLRAHPSDRAKPKHQAKLQSSRSPQNPDARIRSLVKPDQQIDGSAEEELDQHHYHSHRHIHHHHHHHLLYHKGDGVLLKRIRSKDGTNGTSLLSQKLHESLEKEVLKHPHYYIERNGGGCPQYGYFEKNESKYWQPPQLDHRGPSSISVKSSSKSHHALI